MASCNYSVIDVASTPAATNPSLIRNKFKSVDTLVSDGDWHSKIRMAKGQSETSQDLPSSMAMECDILKGHLRDFEKREVEYTDKITRLYEVTELYEQQNKSLTAQAEKISRRWNEAEDQKSTLYSERQKLKKKVSSLESELIDQTAVAEELRVERETMIKKVRAHEVQLQDTKALYDYEVTVNRRLLSKVREFEHMLREQNRDFGTSQDNLLAQVQELMEEARETKSAMKVKGQDNQRLEKEQDVMGKSLEEGNLSLWFAYAHITSMSEKAKLIQKEHDDALAAVKSELEKVSAEKDAIKQELAVTEKTINSDNLILTDALKDFGAAVEQNRVLKKEVEAQKEMILSVLASAGNAGPHSQLDDDEDIDDEEEDEEEEEENDDSQENIEMGPTNSNYYNHDDDNDDEDNIHVILHLQQQLQALQDTNAQNFAAYQAELDDFRVLADEHLAEMDLLREKLAEVRLELENRKVSYGVMAVD